jgi:predicted Zn-dependent peptidase
MIAHTVKSRATVVLALGLAIAASAGPATAQSALDRNIAPTPGKSSILRVPEWTKSMLADGAELIVVEKHNLPLIAFSIEFIGGATTYEPANKLGLASVASQMLSEGTKAKSADQLSDAQQILGASIVTNIGAETGTMRFTSLKSKFEPTLALLADMMLNSVFPDSALERIRGRTLVALTQSRDEPFAIASNVFSTVTYGDAHPYGRVVSEASVKAITHDDVLQFATAYFRPGRAVITVSGDIDPKTARAAVEKALAAWPPGGERPSFKYPPVPTQKTRTIYLVDKPKAAQSVFAFGEPGPSRSTPDVYAISVMNSILGQLFQSRLNHEIREVKGYSYGVVTNFRLGRGPGAFKADAGIVSAKTDSALMAFMTQFKGVRGDIPFTDDEVKQGKEWLIQMLPGRFSTVSGLSSAISSIYAQGLPESYYKTYAANINAVTKSDLVRVAKKYIDLDHMNLVIVGDRATIEGPLKATGIAPIQILDVEGRPVVTQ